MGSEKLAWTFSSPVTMLALYIPQAIALLAMGAPWFGELSVSSPFIGLSLLHSRATMPPLLWPTTTGRPGMPGSFCCSATACSGNSALQLVRLGL